MSLRHVSTARLVGVGLLATSGLWVLGAAQAAPHPKAAHEGQKAEGAKEGRKGGRHGPLHGSNYHPPFAAIVVDDNTDQTIYEVNADEPRHPASVTKVMNLYLLFEQLEAGKVTLDTMLPVSAHCAGQNPVKLGLKPNSTIRAEDALKAMVTKSANDAACTVAEFHGGGDEGEGARLMTVKAHSLGMTNTNYVNGSGLPDEAQITTARDQALLGLIIHNRFPVYYRYFSTLSFNWHGKEMHNHNGLLGNVPGVDGIKTGYTEASGYNLVASVQRGDRHIVSVVLGGTSNGARDTQMHKLIEEHFPHASAQRTAPALTEMVGGVTANPIVAVNGTPQPVTGTPVTPAVAPPAAPMLASTPAAGATRGLQPANSIGASDAAHGGTSPVTGMKADQALKADPGLRQSPKATDKPRARAKQAQTQLLQQPQVQAAAPASAVAHAVHQRNPANRTQGRVVVPQ
jgi:D-alanyl-D-alanine carboxypeptidase